MRKRKGGRVWDTGHAVTRCRLVRLERRAELRLLGRCPQMTAQIVLPREVLGSADGTVIKRPFSLSGDDTDLGLR